MELTALDEQALDASADPFDPPQSGVPDAEIAAPDGALGEKDLASLSDAASMVEPDADAGVEAADADTAAPDVDAVVEAADAEAAATDAATDIPDADAAPPDAQSVSHDAAVVDASPADAARDSGPAADSAVADTSVPDTSVPDAAPPDCELLVGGTTVAYNTGDIGTLDGTQMLSLAQTGQCAMPVGCGTTSGDDVVQGSCSITPCRMWDAVDAGGGWFRLRNVNNGICLYMTDTASGTAAVNSECYTADNMHWQAVCAGNNTWYLVNKYSGLAIGNDGSSGIAQSAQRGAAQRWSITSNASAYTVIMTAADTDTNAVWRYTTSTPSGSWNQASFNDSRWSSGPGSFADQRRGSAALGTSWTSHDIWLRRTFTLSSVPANLALKVFHDEGAEVYINGSSAATLTGWSNGYVSVDVPKSILQSLVIGTNTVAVHCANNTAPQIIDVGLVTYTWQ